MDQWGDERLAADQSDQSAIEWLIICRHLPLLLSFILPLFANGKKQFVHSKVVDVLPLAGAQIDQFSDARGPQWRIKRSSGPSEQRWPIQRSQANRKRTFSLWMEPNNNQQHRVDLPCSSCVLPHLAVYYFFSGLLCFFEPVLNEWWTEDGKLYLYWA